MSKNMKKLEEELDSDNELPNDYNEALEIPVYKDEGRFKPIKFPWINKFTKQQECRAWIPILYSVLNINTVNEKMKEVQDGEKLFLTKGVLNQQDVVCLRSIVTCEATMLWLLNFLMYKDMQSDYNFLRTCLVDNIDYRIYGKSDGIESCNPQNIYKLEIVLK